MNKIFRILELFWLVLACVGIIMCSVFVLTKDNRSAVYFFVITFASGLLFSVRRRQRIKFEAAQKEIENRKTVTNN